MRPYVEEREFTLRLVFRCEFPDDYEGDLDGFAWAEDVPELARAAVRAVTAVLKERAAGRVTSTNRGRPADEEVTLEVTRAP